MPFATGEVAFEIAEGDADAVAIVRVTTPLGAFSCMAELAEEDAGRTLRVVGLHIDDISLGPNRLGSSGLRVVAAAVMERMGYDALVIEGATRTTGAGPGRRPGRLRFALDRRSAPAPRP